ncbi:AraC family transcriptional regulator [Novosphingobium sp.]|uniref:AraC family transcriptional regulator n=1 Tax=Novosphingobium sp. TaxID=1874826 RepID=UPI002601800B|nr:AraC family transcriptional regulator [Novosphingobium sp.]
MSHLDETPLTSSYARVLLAQFAGREAELLAGSGLTTAALMAAERISVRQQLAIFRNAAGIAWRNAQSGWALRYAAGISAAMHGAMGVAAVSAPTVREGLAVVARFARTRDPFMDFRLFELAEGAAGAGEAETRCAGGEIGLEFVTDVVPLGDLDLPMVEICLSFALAMVRVMCGDQAAQCRLAIKAAAPAHLELYREFLPLPCTFAADRNALILPARLAASRSLVADPALHRDATGTCARELAAQGAIFPDAARVRWLIEAGLAACGAEGAAKGSSFADVARALGRSERALSRRLAAAGTSFRQIRDACHAERAKVLLRSTHMTLAEIAARTGYDDAANFSRSFKRLTGMSPGAFRRAAVVPLELGA